MNKIGLFTAFAIFVLTNVVTATALELNAKAYYVANPNTNTVIMQKNAKTPVSPASLAKLMTMYLLFEAIDDEVITLDSKLPISKKAWKKGGSKMFLEVGKTVVVEDLIKGITVSSGNDACIVIAEYLAGDESAFAQQMNEKAKELGMVNTTFQNASGWPHPKQLTTAKDMYILTSSIINKFPQYYSYFGIGSFEYNGIKQPNRNGLLGHGVGVDGLKTGHTKEAGYHLISSATQNNTRLISVVMGTKSSSKREKETLKALTYAFRNFKTYNLVEKQQIMEDSVPVRLGEVASIPAVAAEDFSLYLPRKDREKVKANLVYLPNLEAPIKQGDIIGHLEIISPIDSSKYTINLLAGVDVTKKGFFASMAEIIGEKIGL